MQRSAHTAGPSCAPGPPGAGSKNPARLTGGSSSRPGGRSGTVPGHRAAHLQSLSGELGDKWEGGSIQVDSVVFPLNDRK